jgi:hypothetical protein
MFLRLSLLKSVPIDNVSYMLLDKANRRIVVALKSVTPVAAAAPEDGAVLKQDVLYQDYPTECAAVHAFENLHVDTTLSQKPLA